MQPQRVRVFQGGKLVIPAAMRRELGIDIGDTVVVSVNDGELRVKSLTAAIAHAQSLVRKYVPEGVSLVDELIAERREEAARE
ncbi:MAG: AbrB/MazE/SpoVT family DNA-binding domain-containing protein [Erythrobacter sp.]